MVQKNSSCRIFPGRRIAHRKEKRLRFLWSRLSPAQQKKQLIALLVGKAPASCLYIRLKAAAAQRVGINFHPLFLPETITPAELKKKIAVLNQQAEVAGIMVQLPLPPSLEKEKQNVLDAIAPQKDIDCLTSQNLGRLLAGQPFYLPGVVAAVREILLEAGFKKMDMAGKEACIVGDSSLVGRPMAALLLNWGLTVTVCHQQTRDLAAKTRLADILVSATGHPQLIKGAMVKKGAWVIDVGAPQGDVEKETVSLKASFLTPVPGGVGPMTVVSLLDNFYQAVKRKSFLSSRE